ncbi:DUF397 domain-containing protein [Actinomadura flavalba]|uniref:DUF397 domain-containing protein n=1 Tax=Actinomadura flavalba TaxID=1120938 RepID=UPI0009DBA8FB|nr:DUF397 domain-containing protein [Actinomadura flavalba]
MNLANAAWRKASRSHANDACIELASVVGTVAIRDTKDRDGGTLLVGRSEFRAFVGRVRKEHESQ